MVPRRTTFYKFFLINIQYQNHLAGDPVESKQMPKTVTSRSRLTIQQKWQKHKGQGVER